MRTKTQLGLAICFLAVSVGGRHITAPQGSGRHLEQLSFSIPSSAIPGLLGLVSPTTPSPPPVPGSVPASLDQPLPTSELAATNAPPWSDTQAPGPVKAPAPSPQAASAPSQPAGLNTAEEPPVAPASGIMGLLPEMTNNLLQRMHDNQKDDSNVRAFNVTVSASTAPAPGPNELEFSQQLGNISTEQQGPDIRVDVHVDPVITVNGGVHISANGSEAMPLLASLLPPSPSSTPPPPTIYGGTVRPDNSADGGSFNALPPVTPEETAAFNAGVPPKICGGGLAPFVACPPATQPFMQSLLTRSSLESFADATTNSNSGNRGLAQSPSGVTLDSLLDPALNNSQQDPAKILAAVEGAAQAVNDLAPLGGNAASPSGLPAGSTSSSDTVREASVQASPGSAGSPDYNKGAAFPQSTNSGGIWPSGIDAPSNWALILTATSSTITCVAVIFLVVLFLVFRMGGGRTSNSRDASPRSLPGQALPLKGSDSSRGSQDSPCKRLQRSNPWRERRVRMLRFLDRRTPSIIPRTPINLPTHAAAPRPPDVERSAPTQAPSPALHAQA